MLRLYDNMSSGNGYKARLLLALLDFPFERIELDLDAGETRTPEFLTINPNGRIPVLVTEEGVTLPESNAILNFLAGGTPYLPGDHADRARVLRWMFFEQYSHEPNIAVVRHWISHGPPTQDNERSLPAKRSAGYQALEVMEDHLSGRRYFVGESYTVADIALYAYTHVADEGGFDLGRFPSIRAWLDRVAAHPGHIPIGRD